jgi:hypothetical protein
VRSTDVPKRTLAPSLKLHIQNPNPKIKAQKKHCLLTVAKVGVITTESGTRVLLFIPTKSNLFFDAFTIALLILALAINKAVSIVLGLSAQSCGQICDLFHTPIIPKHA